MGTYAPPVDSLLKLGEPRFGRDWADYATHGIGPDDIPELIRLAQDQELAGLEGVPPEVYAQVHAWRALGQLRAEAAIEPLLDLLVAQEEDDWLLEDLPRVLGMIGPPAIAPTVARLEQRGQQESPAIDLTTALTEIAKHHPSSREEVVRQLSRVLETARENDPAVNGFVISDLMDLGAEEAWPLIEQAFATGNVDESIAGDLADVKYGLGLGPKPPPRMHPIPPHRTSSASTPKERADARARQRKAEKRKAKKKRKGK